LTNPPRFATKTLEEKPSSSRACVHEKRSRGRQRSVAIMTATATPSITSCCATNAHTPAPVSASATATTPPASAATFQAAASSLNRESRCSSDIGTIISPQIRSRPESAAITSRSSGVSFALAHQPASPTLTAASSRHQARLSQKAAST
jgi:hypothetical protein